MRMVYVIPKDRTMKRDEWKLFDRIIRKIAREQEVETNKAFQDAVMVGTGFWKIKAQNA